MATTKDLDWLLQKFVDGGLPGCGLKIMRKGALVYEGYFGYSDLEAKTPVDAGSVFRMASMSKIPLYTTLMMLYERGKFLMNDPISLYLPEWEQLNKYTFSTNGHSHVVPAENPITFRDVFSMKCGLPYCNSPTPTQDLTLQSMQKCMRPLWDKGHFTLREQVAAMSKAVLAAEPGERWIYGFSSELAAALIEAICDKPIDTVFQEMLFDPLGMDSTRSRFFGDIPARMVKLYEKDAQGKLFLSNCPLDEKHLPGEAHEAGWARLFSTVEDYSRLMDMLANGGVFRGKRIIGRKTIDMMRANGLNAAQMKDLHDDYNAGYGYGYGVRTLVDKAVGNHNGSLGAFGWTGGFGTWCEADPTDGVSIVYMHNMIPNEEQYYHLRVRTAAYGCIE